MDNRPIGFFDSGLGGLTCIAPLRSTLPDEHIIYFGDTARTPYGSKSSDTIRSFSLQIADFLVKQNVKMIVIACNTVSSICLTELRSRYPKLPILGIIQPAARQVAESCSEKNNVAVIGTKVTIRSNTYEGLIRELNPKLSIYSTPCPAFVPLIEEGIIQNEIMDLTIRYYLDQFFSYNRIDTLVLGCTHYPLIRKNIEKLYPHLTIVNPSELVVGSIQRTLSQRDMLAEGSSLDNTFYASDLSENFLNMIHHIFTNTGFKVAFKNFDLERGTEK